MNDINNQIQIKTIRKISRIFCLETYAGIFVTKNMIKIFILHNVQQHDIWQIFKNLHKCWMNNYMYKRRNWKENQIIFPQLRFLCCIFDSYQENKSFLWSFLHHNIILEPFWLIFRFLHIIFFFFIAIIFLILYHHNSMTLTFLFA